jgi:hypothetical protein
VLVLFSCKTQVKSIKQTDLSEKKNLEEKRNYYKEAMELCSLHQSPEQIFDLLDKSIRQHDSLCYEIHETQHLDKTYGFRKDIIKSDTLRWKKLCAECEKIVSLEDFHERQNEKELAYKKKKAMLESKLDNNLFDKKLIALLAEIIEKDQRIRNNVNINKQESKWKEQKQLDSLNLIEIDAIFKAEGGYPRLQKVGYDHISIPWYVLHHQSSSVVRRKYMHFIEDAVQKGDIFKSSLDNYKNRTLEIEEKEIRP